MNVYEIVTNRIIEMLEKDGQIPWKKPWKSTGAARNLITRKPYKGINSFILNCNNFSSSYWLTFKQAQDKGGYIRKGERSTLVCFYKWINTTSESASPEEFEQDNPSCIKKIPLLRYYNVFNLDQTEGIESPAEELPTPEFTPIERAEQIINQMQNMPTIFHGGDRASYSPALDRICMPQKEAFHSSAGYYACLYHEISHSTGHHTRLNRKGITEPSYFGSHDYSHEELVAEFSASMICAYVGIELETLTNSAAYIQNWLEVLKNDKRLAIIAAGQAQKASDYILNFKEEPDPEIAD